MVERIVAAAVNHPRVLFLLMAAYIVAGLVHIYMEDGIIWM